VVKKNLIVIGKS